MQEIGRAVRERREAERSGEERRLGGKNTRGSAGLCGTCGVRRRRRRTGSGRRGSESSRGADRKWARISERVERASRTRLRFAEGRRSRLLRCSDSRSEEARDNNSNERRPSHDSKSSSRMRFDATRRDAMRCGRNRTPRPRLSLNSTGTAGAALLSIQVRHSPCAQNASRELRTRARQLIFRRRVCGAAAGST